MSDDSVDSNDKVKNKSLEIGNELKLLQEDEYNILCKEK